MPPEIEYLRRMFDEIRAASGLAQNELNKLVFLGPTWEEIDQQWRGLVTYEDNPYVCEIPIAFTRKECEVGEISVVAEGYATALAKLMPEIPKVSRAAAALRRLNGIAAPKKLIDVVMTPYGVKSGLHRIFHEQLTVPRGSVNECEVQIDPTTGISQVCPHGVQYRWRNTSPRFPG